MIIATAGHIDHGKTTLIRALTGVDTDRLPEEKARGISIDLGFAYWRPAAGELLGFVDVPGHERFVRNMLAGVAAIDCALLVIAADDGVMPQSIEHVQILDLLRVSQGFVALNKCDCVTRDRIEAVREQVRGLLHSTSLAAAPILEVSATTGAGLDVLADALRVASRAHQRRATAGRYFRLAIDRAFSVTGAGTVVTGTTVDGVLAIGAQVVLAPSGTTARVRGLQSGGQETMEVRAGERCAVNLVGVEVADVRRGDWLLDPALYAPTARIEVRLRSLAQHGEGLRHQSAAHLHLGTADIAARVLIAGQTQLAAGSEAIVQLALEQPTCAVVGDRFVLRDQSGRHLLGGGGVIDPFASADRRRNIHRAAIQTALQSTDAASALPALLRVPGYELDTARFERSFNVQGDTAAALYERCGAVLLGKDRALALSRQRVDELCQQILAALREFHRASPHLGGMTTRELKDKITAPVSSVAFLDLLHVLGGQQQLATSGAFVRLTDHVPSFSAAETALWTSALPRLEQRGAQPFTADELAAELKADPAAIKLLLYRRRSNGEIWRITNTRFLLRAQTAALAAAAAQLARAVGGKGFTAAQYRDAIGTGRGLAIQILEFFDTAGVTHRNGDLRRMRPDYVLVVGAAAPYAPGQGNPISPIA